MLTLAEPRTGVVPCCTERQQEGVLAVADRVDELEQEMVVDLLRSWIDVYDKGVAAYDAFPPDIREWIDRHGHRVESLVPVVAFMQPEVRVVCRALVVGALADIENLSQGSITVDPAVEQTIVPVELRGGVVAEERDLAGEIEELR